MKIDFLEPEGDLTPDLVSDATLLLESSDHRTATQLHHLTEIELRLVYDWAMREHMRAAGNQVRRRPRPKLMDFTRGDDDESPSDFDRPEVETAREVSDSRVIADQAREIAKLIGDLADHKRRLDQATSDLEEVLSHLTDVETAHAN